VPRLPHFFTEPAQKEAVPAGGDVVYSKRKALIIAVSERYLWLKLETG